VTLVIISVLDVLFLTLIVDARVTICDVDFKMYALKVPRKMEALHIHVANAN